MTQLTCRGTKAIARTYAFRSADAAVVRVNPASGLVTAVASGSVMVGIEPSETHADGVVSVTVH